MKITKTLRDSRGMTLIEILIVMAIIGTLMAVLLPQVMNRLGKSQVNSTKLAMGQVIQALNLYYSDCGKYPASLEGLITADDCSNWGPTPYLKKEIKDTWNTSFQYAVEGGNFTLKSFGRDKREGGDGLDKDITQDDVN